MRLILSVDALSPPLSGIGRYAWELVSRLSLSGSVDSIRYFHQGRWINNPEDLLNPALHPLNKTWLQKKEPKWVLDQRLMLQCRGQLFHGPNYFLPACADTGVATVHDLSVFKFPETHPAERIKQFEIHFMDTLGKASYLITDTEAIRQEVIKTFSWPEERIAAVSLGVADLYRPYLSQGISGVLARYGLEYGKYSLCVSTIEPRKKIDVLLTAYGCLSLALREQFPLVLIGNAGWNSEGLHQQIETCCAEGWLNYFGFVSEVDLPVLYAGARLFVYPSCYEGFGLPVLEAMASGVPVITSTDPALVEVAGDVALAVEPDDDSALLQAITRGLEDSVWREKVVEAGLLRARQFTWELCIEKTVKVYRGLI